MTCVYALDPLDDAIDRANALPVAFQASVFANDITVALHAADRLDASAVIARSCAVTRTTAYGLCSPLAEPSASFEAARRSCSSTTSR
jgi:acyl-CoA reductase-like NAD-dependent aldehyde dehydrogenase